MKYTEDRNEMKTAFIVLHYENLEDTKKCVDSLIKCFNDENISIVIVDNGSINEKINTLEKNYKKYKNIYYIYSDENLGFAKGNNLGFAYAKECFKADLIILCNNDLLFEQKEFLNKLYQHYNEDNFDIAGPKIISLVDGLNQNPVPVLYDTDKKLILRIIKYRILLLMSYIGIDIFFKKRISKKIEEYVPDTNEDYQLFGACLIFSKNYIQHFDGLYSGTFMYNEESILKERAIKYNLQMKYYDDIEVKHKEGASTQKIHGFGVKKRRFYYYWNLRGCQILKKIRKGKERI